MSNGKDLAIVQIAYATKTTEDAVRSHRKSLDVVPAYKLVDTCAAEFEAETPYYYSTYEEETEVIPSSSSQGDDSRRWAKSDRSGDRIRLLLLSCCLRPQQAGIRDDHGQLQSGDGFDRL